MQTPKEQGKNSYNAQATVAWLQDAGDIGWFPACQQRTTGLWNLKHTVCISAENIYLIKIGTRHTGGKYCEMLMGEKKKT